MECQTCGFHIADTAAIEWAETFASCPSCEAPMDLAEPEDVTKVTTDYGHLLVAADVPQWLIDSAAKIITEEGGVTIDSLGRYVVKSATIDGCHYVVTRKDAAGRVPKADKSAIAVDHGRWACTCPASKVCKHILAAVHVHAQACADPAFAAIAAAGRPPKTQPEDPFAGLELGMES